MLSAMATGSSGPLVMDRLLRGARLPKQARSSGSTLTLSRAHLAERQQGLLLKEGPRPSTVAPAPRRQQHAVVQVRAKLTRVVNRETRQVLRSELDRHGPVPAPVPRVTPSAADLREGSPRRGAPALAAHLRRLAKGSAGAKRMRQILAKRDRARRRQQSHTWRLRATQGQMSLLEEISTGRTTSVDYRNRLMRWPAEKAGASSSQGFGTR